MTLQTLFVVNRAGGLIYSRELSPGGKLSGNEYLVLASTFHSLHAISKQLAPVPSGGITSVDAPSFSLHCLESPTGMKFFTTAKPNTRDVHGFLRKVYEFYADFVLKNPFYELDMPIRLRVRVPLGFACAHDPPFHILIRDCCVLTIVHLLPPVFLLISSLSTASRVTHSHSGLLVLRRQQWRLRYSPVRPVRRWLRCRQALHCAHALMRLIAAAHYPRRTGPRRTGQPRCSEPFLDAGLGLFYSRSRTSATARAITAQRKFSGITRH